MHVSELESQDSDIGSITYDGDLESPSGVGLEPLAGSRSRLRGFSESSSVGPDIGGTSPLYDRQPLLSHDEKVVVCYSGLSAFVFVRSFVMTRTHPALGRGGRELCIFHSPS